MDEPNETDNPHDEIESDQPLANMNSDPEKRVAGSADHEPEITSDQPLAQMNDNPGDAKDAEGSDEHAS